MAPRPIDPADNLASALPSGGRTLVVACSGESLLLADALMRAGEALRHVVHGAALASAADCEDGGKVRKT